MSNQKTYEEAVKRAEEVFTEYVKIDEEERKSERRYNPYNWIESDRDTIVILFTGFLECERKAYNGDLRYHFTESEMYYLEIALEQVPHKEMKMIFNANKDGVCTVSDWRNKTALISRLRELAKSAKERTEQPKVISENDLPPWFRK